MSADNQQERLGRVDGQYIAGFVDGEGSFHIAFQKRDDLKFGWQAVPEFHISQNFTSRDVLEKIREVFQCGYIKANDAPGKRDKSLVYVVRDRKDLVEKIVPFFGRYPLQTAKRKDFESFRTVVEMMMAGGHLTIEGFEKIVRIAFAMNMDGRYRKRKASEIFSVLASSETIR